MTRARAIHVSLIGRGLNTIVDFRLYVRVASVFRCPGSAHLASLRHESHRFVSLPSVRFDHRAAPRRVATSRLRFLSLLLFFNIFLIDLPNGELIWLFIARHDQRCCLPHARTHTHTHTCTQSSAAQGSWTRKGSSCEFEHPFRIRSDRFGSGRIESPLPPLPT